VLKEINQANENLRRDLSQLISSIDPTVLEVSERAQELADFFIDNGAVPPSKPEDAQHVAIAFENNLDVMVSWNFRHLVNIHRSDRFNSVAMLKGDYNPLRIVSPPEFFYDEEDD
jgi:hypothetical protein